MKAFLSRHWVWARWPFAAILMGLLWWMNRHEFAHLQEREIRWGFFLLACVVSFLSIGLTFFRWFLLVRALKFEFSFGEAVRLGFLGQLCAYAGPGTLGGDFIKAVWLAKDQKSRRLTAALTVLLDRILGLMALFFVGAGASLLPTSVQLGPELQTVIWGLWGGTLASLVGLTAILSPAITSSKWLDGPMNWRLGGKLITGLVSAARLYQNDRQSVISALLLSIVGHIGILSSFYLCALALHPGRAIPDYSGHLLFIPAAEIFGVLVPTPGGLGALEAAVQTLYGLAAGTEISAEARQAAEADGLLTAVAFRVITLMIAGVGLVYYFASRKQLIAVVEEGSPTDNATPSKLGAST